jgi:hypothetical protein
MTVAVGSGKRVAVEVGTMVSGVLEGVIIDVTASGASGASLAGVGLSGKICFALDVTAQPERAHARTRIIHGIAQYSERWIARKIARGVVRAFTLLMPGNILQNSTSKMYSMPKIRETGFQKSKTYSMPKLRVSGFQNARCRLHGPTEMSAR